MLTTVYDADKPKLERVDATSEDISGIGSCIHQIKFGKNTDGTFAVWIDRARQFEGVGVGEIDICGGYGENHAAKVIDVMIIQGK